jgi:myosin-9
MEMVGFSPEKQNRCFQVLSAVLHLGNVEFSKKSTYHSDETVLVKNCDELEIISKLLLVKEETLMTALTCKKTKAAKGEMLVINYRLCDAIATRDAMAKCLYGALFDWIVMQVNHALITKKDARDHKGIRYFFLNFLSDLLKQKIFIRINFFKLKRFYFFPTKKADF